MTRALADEIAGYLAGRGERTLTDIARGISARDMRVLDALTDDPRFYIAEQSTSGNRLRRVYGLRTVTPDQRPIPGRQSAPQARGMAGNGSRATHAERLLAVLSDGAWHSHHDLYRLGLIVHSRISDLRARGHRIEMRRDGDAYLYRLVSADRDEVAA